MLTRVDPNINHSQTLKLVFSFCAVLSAIIHLSCLITPFHKPTLTPSLLTSKTNGRQHGGRNKHGGQNYYELQMAANRGQNLYPMTSYSQCRQAQRIDYHMHQVLKVT